MSPGVLATCFSPERLAARLPRPGSWRPYPALQDRAPWDAVQAATRDHVLGQAARILANPWPVLTASAYARFFTDGDRQAYEKPYFARRSRLGAAVLTAALAGPTSERLRDVTDGIWLLCEETSWCVPAAELVARQDGARLPDPARPVVDLFAAETAALLAYTDLLAGDLIEPILRRRLRDEVRARVLDPYRDSDRWWWLGLRKKDLNNWTPWIHANLLTASLLLDDRPADVAVTTERAVGALDRYLAAVPDDGGCDEGITYWWRAGGSLFECLETLACACGEDYGVFAISKIRAIARYPVIVHIAGPWHVNFADGSPAPHGAAPHLLYRFGRRIGDREVAQHARALRGDQAAADLIAGANGSIARVLSAMFDSSWGDEPPRAFPMPAQAWLPVTGVLTARSQAGRAAGLFLAAKAGHNGESHNHNDVGSFVVALDGRPLLIDVGVGVYTRQTFGPERYEIWTMQSSWHNVPEVDGIPQAPGRQYAARRVQGLLRAGAAELSMDLAGAYPPEAGIRSWRRTVRLDRGAAGRGTIVVEDSWDLSHRAERTVVHLIAAAKPRDMAAVPLVIPADGRADPDRGLALDYSREDFDAGIEERPVGDPRLAATWGTSIYRITFAARRPGGQTTFRLRINAAGSDVIL
ncbi:MAG: heparinase II/III-family protein [Actinomycetota bacterium]|nr:heparinase II/III-family protein [Actinomycetota bacterium]